MNTTIDLLLLCLGVLLVGLGWYLSSKSSTKRIEFEVDFIPGSIENVLEHFRTIRKKEIAGILGTNFLEKHKYVIDFKRNIVRHNFYRISFDETMKTLKIPYITLWQNGRKYIFLLDTGSTECHISNKALETLDFEFVEGRICTTDGATGGITTKGTVKTKLYYK